MKFMVLAKATADSEAGRMPELAQIESMIRFNEQLGNAGILLATEGLWPSSKGRRLRFDAGRTTVTDGPFAETKELIGGFWIVQGKSIEEVVERFSHAPLEHGEVLEIRQVIDAEDFGDLPPELREITERVTLPEPK